MTAAKKTADEYTADIYAQTADNQNRLQKIIETAMPVEMVAAIERAHPDPNVSTPAIERALEKWRNETDPPRWPNKIGDTSIRTYRKTKHGIV